MAAFTGKINSTVGSVIKQAVLGLEADLKFSDDNLSNATRIIEAGKTLAFWKNRAAREAKNRVWARLKAIEQDVEMAKALDTEV